MVELPEILGERTAVVGHIELTPVPPASAMDEKHPPPQVPGRSTSSHRNNSNEAFEESHRSTISRNESSDRKRTPLPVASPTRRGKLTKEQRRSHPFARRRTKPNLNSPTPRTPAAATPSEKRRGTKASNRRRFVPSPPGFQSLVAPPTKNFICRQSEP